MELMGLGLQITLVVGAIFAMSVVLVCAIKVKMNIRYAIVWIIWAGFMLVLGLFPSMARFFADCFGIQTVSNLVFLIMTALLYGLSFYSTIKMSKMNEEMKRLVYEVAHLKKVLKDNERK